MNSFAVQQSYVEEELNIELLHRLFSIHTVKEVVRRKVSNLFNNNNNNNNGALRASSWGV